ncbi:MAG: exodeoxyribonuclease VII small subunit [Oligoflexia bacterium]|nr:exodeoxyribonuclease VII small subunit [Oligoflexia bacterium]
MNNKKNDKNDTLDWEKSLQELETIVKEFEGEKLSLNQSLKKFEQGVILYKNCKNALSQVETKIKVLTDSLKEENLFPESQLQSPLPSDKNNE